MSSSSSQPECVGLLQETDASGKVLRARRVYASQEITIGRDGNRCQIVLDDPVVSNKHLRIYTVIYENNKPNEIAPLVYAEDLSRNGTFWNGSLIGKGNGGFLLSDGDTLRVSSRTHFVFLRCVLDEEGEPFDMVQEDEMKKFEKEYLITDRLLGSGAYGRVHMAIEQSRRTQLACKMVDLRKLQPPPMTSIGRWETPAAAEDVDGRFQMATVKSWAARQMRDNRGDDKLKIYCREAEILASIHHPNIIGLEKVYVSDNSIYIFQDLVTAGDLFSYIDLNNGKLLEVEAAVIVRQITIALNFLHDNNIVHRDLKPANILMTTLAIGCRVVLTDFGCARTIQHDRARMSTTVGTTEYSAPEVLGAGKATGKKRGYTKAVDMWALGCVTVVLLTGGYPFQDPRTDEYSDKLARDCNMQELERSHQWVDVGTRPKDFVRRLLVLDEQQRMAASEALRHAWFTNDVHKTDFEELYQRAIRHWKPRMPKRPVIQFIEGSTAQDILSLQDIETKKTRKKGPAPIDPPYKPFPRRMNQSFFPRRRASLFVSEEVRSAINKNWTLRKDPDNHEVGLPPSTPSGSHRPRTPIGKNSNASDSERSLKPPIPFKPLFPKRASTPLQHSAGRNEVAGSLQGATATNHERPESYSARPESMTRRAFSPTAWNEEPPVLTADRTTATKLRLPSRPATPKPSKIPARPLCIASTQLRPMKALSETSLPVVSGADSVSPVGEPQGSSPVQPLALSCEQSPKSTTPLGSGQNEGLFLALSEERPDGSEAEMPLSSATAIIDSDPFISETPRRGQVVEQTHKETDRGILRSSPNGINLQAPFKLFGNGSAEVIRGSKKRRSNSIFDFPEDEGPCSGPEMKRARQSQEPASIPGVRKFHSLATGNEFQSERQCSVAVPTAGNDLLQEEIHLGGLYLPRV